MSDSQDNLDEVALKTEFNLLAAQIIDSQNEVTKTIEFLLAAKDSTEKQLAILTTAYAEVVVMVQSLVGMVSGDNQEELDRFRDLLQNGRKEMLSIFKQAAKVDAEMQQDQPFHAINDPI